MPTKTIILRLTKELKEGWPILYDPSELGFPNNVVILK